MNKEVIDINKSTALATKEYMVSSTGEAYMSQRELERLLGLSSGAISRYISRQHPNYVNNKGLSSEIVESASTYYAFERVPLNIKG